MHRRLNVMQAQHFPAYVVWELTLRCDQHCTHCGSRAADARDNELTGVEALGIVEQLAAMGAREVVLIGGEAYLHDAFVDVVAALKAAGIRPTMTTGGRGLTADLVPQMAQAGLFSVSISVDGLEQTHDAMRGTRGSFAATVASGQLIRDAGMQLGANTNINRFNAADVEGLYEHLRTQHIRFWQVQLTAPLGRAADRPDMILQPYDLLTLLPRLAALKQRAISDGITMMPGNNLGYFGPEEALMRSPKAGMEDHWAGCQAGRFVMGLESNGAVKGCPSLQTAHYVGGNVRDTPLQGIWNHAPELAFTRRRTVEDLWGFCRSCDFGEVCLGGCSFTAHAILGRPGNNPYCHYRAKTLAARGLRERLSRREAAPGTPFDNGLFDVVQEPLDAPDPQPESRTHRLRVVA